LAFPSRLTVSSREGRRPSTDWLPAARREMFSYLMERFRSGIPALRAGRGGRAVAGRLSQFDFASLDISIPGGSGCHASVRRAGRSPDRGRRAGCL
jgi:hypothetical protein